MDSTPFTILVAEDEDEMRSLVGNVLRRNGYKVLEAANGEEALELASGYSGPIHLLLTDITMPVLNGWELHRRLRTERPGTATLFMSGNFEPTLMRFSVFLPKPFGPAQLLEKVRGVFKSPADETEGKV